MIKIAIIIPLLFGSLSAKENSKALLEKLEIPGKVMEGVEKVEFDSRIGLITFYHKWGSKSSNWEDIYLSENSQKVPDTKMFQKLNEVFGLEIPLTEADDSWELNRKKSKEQLRVLSIAEDKRLEVQRELRKVKLEQEKKKALADKKAKATANKRKKKANSRGSIAGSHLEIFQALEGGFLAHKMALKITPNSSYYRISGDPVFVRSSTGFEVDGNKRIINKWFKDTGETYTYQTRIGETKVIKVYVENEELTRKRNKGRSRKRK